MRKKQFLKELEDNLYGLSKEDTKEILDDYREHFKIGKKNKRKESEIAKSLGDPKKIAKEAKKELQGEEDSFRHDLSKIWTHVIVFIKQILRFFKNILKGDYSKEKEILREGYKNFNKAMGTFFKSEKLWLIVLNLFIAFPVWITLLSVIISLVISAWAIIISGIICILVIIFSLAMPFVFPVKNLLLSGLFASIGLIFLGIIILILTLKPVRMFFKLTGKYIIWNKKCFSGENNGKKN